MRTAQIAKITRPNTSAVLPRKRLFDIIDRSRKYPVIFITSPPGAGKTSLIASYLEHRKIPCLWYSIDRGDADIATFFHYMRLAAGSLSPAKRRLPPSYTPDYVFGASVFARRFFEHLFGITGTPFVLVIDRYEHIPLNSRFHETLVQGFSDLPEGVNIIIAGRKGPPPSIYRIYLQGKATVIGWDAIRFTLEEVKALAGRHVSVKLDDGFIESLFAQTDGWAAGFLLSLKGIGNEDVHNRFLEGISSRSVFDYFASEILQKEDKDTRKFLLMTSFLPVFTVKMAERLTGDSHSEKILKALSRECCFLKTYSDHASVYRYHPLFREFLIARARKAWHKEKLHRIKSDAALIIEESGYVEDAVQLLKETGEAMNVIAIIQRWAPSMVNQGRYQTLLSWLEIIPEEILLGNPWLLYWMGVCYLPFHPAQSKSYFEKAFDFFSSRNESSGVFLAWAGIIESIIYGREGLKPVDHWSEILKSLMTTYGGFPSEEIETDVTCSVLRMLSLRKPHGFDTARWVAGINAIIQNNTDVQIKTKALVSLAGYLYSQGDFTALGLVLESLQPLLSQYEVPPLVRLTSHWMQAAFCDVNSLYDNGQKVVSEGLELAGSLKIRLMEYMLMGHGVLSALKKRDNAAAQQYLQKMASGLSLTKPWEAGFYHYCAAWKALYQDNVAKARTHSEICMNLYQDIGNPWTLTIAHLLQAYVYHASGDTQKAIQGVSDARSLGIQTGNLYTSFICSLSESYFYLHWGKGKKALELIRKGLHIGKENGFVNIFMWPKGVMERILIVALEHDIEADFVKKLIRINDVLPDRRHANDDRWPWPIKIYTLGRFGLLKDGSPMQFTGKIQQKPLAILKALIAFGGREVSEERLADILWPEADGDKAHNAFTTTLSRLRQLLGAEKAIGFHEGKAVLDSRYCWVDVWAFERLLGEAASVWEKGASEKEKEEAVKLSQRAIRMYTGPFLPGENEPWMVSIRERLRNKVLRLIKRCGNYCEESGAFEHAIEFYHKGIVVDVLIEEFYRRMMICYDRLGRRAEALSVYAQCANVLSSILGIRPAEETEALARQLKR